MINLLQTLDFSTYFFTQADFDVSLLEIENLLKKSSSKEFQPLSSQIELLEKAYVKTISCIKLSQKMDKQLTYLLSDILRRYGYLHLGIDPIATKQILLAALQVNSFTINLIQDHLDFEDFETLNDLKQQLRNDPDLFDSMQKVLLSHDVDHWLSLAYADTFMTANPNQRLVDLAQIVGWICDADTHIDDHLIKNERAIELFRLSESLLLLANDRIAHKDLADLYCVQPREGTIDLTDISRIYDKALAYDNSIEMQLKVSCKRFLAYFKTSNKYDAEKIIKTILESLEKIPDSNENSLLKSDAYYCYATHLLEHETYRIEEAEQSLKVAQSYAEKVRKQGFELFAFATYDIKFAEIKFVIGDQIGAREIAQRALDNLKRNPGCHCELLDYAKAFIHSI